MFTVDMGSGLGTLKRSKEDFRNKLVEHYAIIIVQRLGSAVGGV